MTNKHQSPSFNSPRRLTVVACAAAIAAGFQSIPTLAQDTALEEVIVSATRRDESIQDVAVSVAAITKELGQAQVRRLEDLQTFRPSVPALISDDIRALAALRLLISEAWVLQTTTRVWIRPLA
jgi:outer membrane receptor protein involved in Fe transport